MNYDSSKVSERYNLQTLWRNQTAYSLKLVILYIERYLI